MITAAHCLQTKDKKKLATGGDIFMGFAYYKHATINNSYRVEFLEKNIEIHPNEDIDVAAIQFTDETPFKGDNVINITVNKTLLHCKCTVKINPDKNYHTSCSSSFRIRDLLRPGF